MNKLVRSGAILNLKNEDFHFLQDSLSDSLAEVLKGFTGGTNETFILSGCDVVNDNGTSFTVESGVVVIEGEVCMFPQQIITYNSGGSGFQRPDYLSYKYKLDKSYSQYGKRNIQGGGTEDTWEIRTASIETRPVVLEPDTRGLDVFDYQYAVDTPYAVREDLGETVNPLDLSREIDYVELGSSYFEKSFFTPYSKKIAPTLYELITREMGVSLLASIVESNEYMSQPVAEANWTISEWKCKKDASGTVHLRFLATSTSNLTGPKVFDFETGWSGDAKAPTSRANLAAFVDDLEFKFIMASASPVFTNGESIYVNMSF